MTSAFKSLTQNEGKAHIYPDVLVMGSIYVINYTSVDPKYDLKGFNEGFHRRYTVGPAPAGHSFMFTQHAHVFFVLIRNSVNSV